MVKLENNNSNYKKNSKNNSIAINIKQQKYQLLFYIEFQINYNSFYLKKMIKKYKKYKKIIAKI